MQVLEVLGAFPKISFVFVASLSAVFSLLGAAAVVLKCDKSLKMLYLYSRFKYSATAKIREASIQGNRSGRTPFLLSCSSRPMKTPARENGTVPCSGSWSAAACGVRS